MNGQHSISTLHIGNPPKWMRDAKNHEGKKEVFLDDYLKKFLENNFDINKIINQM